MGETPTPVGGAGFYFYEIKASDSSNWKDSWAGVVGLDTRFDSVLDRQWEIDDNHLELIVDDEIEPAKRIPVTSVSFAVSPPLPISSSLVRLPHRIRWAFGPVNFSRLHS